jgi:hypothetical protein
VTHGLGDSKVKVVVDHPLPALQGRELIYIGIKSRLARVGKVVHPCRVKSFRKAVSTVMDDLGTDVEIIENFNLIVKLGNQCVLTDTFFGY